MPESLEQLQKEFSELDDLSAKITADFKVSLRLLYAHHVVFKRSSLTTMQELVSSYGEKPNTSKPEEFFGTISNFMNAWEAEVKAIKLAKLKEAKVRLSLISIAKARETVYSMESRKPRRLPWKQRRRPSLPSWRHEERPRRGESRKRRKSKPNPTLQLRKVCPLSFATTVPPCFLVLVLILSCCRQESRSEETGPYEHDRLCFGLYEERTSVREASFASTGHLEAEETARGCLESCRKEMSFFPPYTSLHCA